MQKETPSFSASFLPSSFLWHLLQATFFHVPGHANHLPALFFGRRFSTSPVSFIFLSLFCIFSLLGFLQFITTLGFNAENIADYSSKRAVFEDGVRMNYGYIRWLCSLSVPVFILVLMLMVQKKVGRLSWWTPLLVLSCLISIAWAFFTSSRTALIVLGIQAVMVSHFLKKPSLRSPASLLKKVLKWGLPVLILFLIMATLRENKHSREEVTESLILTGPIHRIIGSGNFFGVAKTSIALDQIPRPVDYLYGKSLITWIYSPIPRSLWPDKPSMGLGFQFGEEVLGYNMERIKNGKTPSFLWNFTGISGGRELCSASLDLVFFLGRFYLFFKPLLENQRIFGIALYVSTIYPASMFMMSTNLSVGIVRIIQHAVTISFMLLIITRREKSSSPTSLSPSPQRTS